LGPLLPPVLSALLGVSDLLLLLLFYLLSRLVHFLQVSLHLLSTIVSEFLLRLFVNRFCGLLLIFQILHLAVEDIVDILAELILIGVVLLVCQLGLDHEFAPLVLFFLQVLDLPPAGVQHLLLQLRLRVVLFLHLILLLHLRLLRLFLGFLEVEVVPDLAAPFQNRTDFPLTQQLQIVE